MSERSEGELRDDAAQAAAEPTTERPEAASAQSVSSSEPVGDPDVCRPGDAADGNDSTSHTQRGPVNIEQSAVFEQFRGDLEAVERKIASEIDPGSRAMVVAGTVFVLLLTLVLPHAGHTKGLDILFFDNTAHADHIGLPSRVFEWIVLVFGIGFSSLALLTRRWTLAWIAVAGSAVGAVFGVLSIWHRQTPGIGNYHGAGPAVGLILATLAMVVLTFHWVKVVWSRTALQLEAEEQRRVATKEREERQRRWLLGEDN
jgi:hypothetical protein